MKILEGSFDGRGLNLAVIASRFHEAIVDRLLEGAMECLERHGVSSDAIEIVRVPGAFEIPAVAAELARRGSFDALITIGVLVRGDTPHFDFISSQVTQGISRVSVEHGTPISFGVITCNTIEQARQRTERGNNKGWEAALAAIELATLFKELARGREGERASGRTGEKKQTRRKESATTMTGKMRSRSALSPSRPLALSPGRKGGR